MRAALIEQKLDSVDPSQEWPESYGPVQYGSSSFWAPFDMDVGIGNSATPSIQKKLVTRAVSLLTQVFLLAGDFKGINTVFIRKI